MPGHRGGSIPDAHFQAEEMLHAITSAEQIIVSAIERECEALRTGRMLAARALHTQLCDAARMYLDTTRAAQASIDSLERSSPGICGRLEERRANFASLLKVELAILATERAAVFNEEGDVTPRRTASELCSGASERGGGRSARLVAIEGGAALRPLRRRIG